MKNGPIDVDFIKKNTSKKDIELFLGPVDKKQEQVFFDLKDGMLIAHFMHQAGVFKSVSEARKNGWNKSIPEGFSTFVVSKKRSKITILNIID